MNRNNKTDGFLSPAARREGNAWCKPSVIRLEAGAAESAIRQVIGDGPLSQLS